MTGVEVSYLLRSADAPERFVLRYGGGVVLRDTKEAGVDVLRDGKLVAQVTPPRAWDADGQPVAMRLRADGDRLVVEVDHRDGDFAYPIVADPYTGEDFAYSDGRTSVDDQAGWNRVSTASSGSPRDTYADPQCTDTGGRFCFGIYSWFYGSGLYTWMRDGHTPGFDNTYSYGDIGEWIYQAPGQSYIYRFDMWQLRNEYDSSCSYQGLFSPSSNRWEEQSYWDPSGGAHTPARVAGDYPPRMSCGTSNTDWLAVCAGQWECRNGEADYSRHIREGGNYAVFGTQIFNTQIPSFTNFLGAANISIGDRDNPQINDISGPAGWTNDPNAKIYASASDPGLGVRQLKLHAPDQPDWNGTRDSTPVCNGDRNSRCSTWRAHTVDVGDLREGRHPILAEATDPVDRRSPTREISVSVDRSGPTVALDGALWEARASPLRGEGQELRIRATDGEPSTAASGVKRIEVRWDGRTVLASANTPCAAGNCAGALEYQFKSGDLAGIPDGVHELQVVAVDQLDNTSVTSHHFFVDDNGQSISASEESSGAEVEAYDAPSSQDMCSLDPAATDACSTGETDETVEALNETPLTGEDPGAASQPAGAAFQRQASGANPQTYGLSDQGPVFQDARFAALNIKHARYIVPYDLYTRARPPESDTSSAAQAERRTIDDSIEDYRQWMASVTQFNKGVPSDKDLIPLIAIQPSRGNGRPAPSDSGYRDGIAAFRARNDVAATATVPSEVRVRFYTPFNEPNLSGQSSGTTGATRAGRFWAFLDSSCRTVGPTCSVAAGDFADGGSLTKAYIAAYKQGLNDRGHYPRIWAIHTYGAGGYPDVESRIKQFRYFLSTTGSARIWMTEQGGRQRRNNVKIHSESEQNVIAARLLRLPKDADTKRVTRFYYYQWRGELKYDAGLIDFATDNTRTAYSTYKNRTNP